MGYGLLRGLNGGSFDTVCLTPQAQKALAEIDAYIRQHNPAYRAWYAGIATDPRQRLFVEHGVNQHPGVWIFRDCGTEVMARAVERVLLGKNCQGGPGGGNRPSHVYAYLVTGQTRQ